MSTFILNPGDTIVISDSIAVKLTKMAETCQSCVKVPETNSSDVAIAAIICVSVLIMALIVSITVGYCRNNDNKTKKAEGDAIRTHEENMKKTEASLKEQAEKNNHDRKLESMIMEKTLGLMVEDYKNIKTEKRENTFDGIKDTIINVLNNIINRFKK